jgi:hypothetical protein
MQRSAAETRRRKSIPTCLDGVDGGVGEGAHGTRDEANHHMLVRWQFDEVRLYSVRELLDFLVGSEVGA